MVCFFWFCIFWFPCVRCLVVSGSVLGRISAGLSCGIVLRPLVPLFVQHVVCAPYSLKHRFAF